MSNIKKMIIASLVSFSCLSADVFSLTTHIGTIKYDDSLTKSLKDDGSFLGLHTSIGDKEYLLEAAYSYTNISYKNSSDIQNLRQHDLSMIYTAKYSSYTLRVGAHYINNNEATSFKDLGSGYIGIASLEGYNFFDEDKFTYGVQAYYSIYPNAHDDTTKAYTQLIDIVQFTPYLEYSMVFNPSIRNDIALKLNAIAVTQYKNRGYLSFELSDTFVYENFYIVLKAFGGEMKSGVVDGGLEVINTKDLHTSSYSAKMGYYLTPTLALDASYAINYYQEYNAYTLTLAPEGHNRVAMVSLNYSY